MTALAMPGDYGMEMLLGTSPVLGSGFLSSHASPFLPDFSRFQTSILSVRPTSDSLRSPGGVKSAAMDGDPPPPQQSASAEALRRTGSNFGRHSTRQRKKGTVVSPILIPGRSSQQEAPTLQNGAVSPSREKKKVSFADANGLQLAQIKVIKERPDSPPNWAPDFLEKVAGLSEDKNVYHGEWKLTFAQPAADYLGFRCRLERNNVALENVYVESSAGQVIGTVKVRNISYYKNVVVRYTSNNWASFLESVASYVPSMSATTASYDLYDKFKFQFELPTSPRARKIEFCVCFRCEGQEHWDNNECRNYSIVCESDMPIKSRRPSDLYDVAMESWSEFTPWKHLPLDNAPYW